MKRRARSLLVATLLGGAGMSHATPRFDVVAPAPETPESRQASREQMARDIAAWLPKMVGRFEYQGVVQFLQTLRPGAQVIREFPDLSKVYADGTCDETCESDIPNVKDAHGKADCIAIGKGAGVQCVINVVWDDEWSPQGLAVEGGVSFLGPGATLYGFDPGTQTIRYLLLNTNGIAGSEAGPLRGGTVSWTFETHCESDTSERCRQVTRVRIPEGGAPRTSIDIEKWDAGRWLRLSSFTLDMRRVSIDAAPAAGAKSKRRAP